MAIVNIYYHKFTVISDNTLNSLVIENIARSHTPAVAIRGCNTLEKDKIVKDFIILKTEKTLMENVHMYYVRVTEGKLIKKRRQNED